MHFDVLWKTTNAINGRWTSFDTHQAAFTFAKSMERTCGCELLGVWSVDEEGLLLDRQHPDYVLVRQPVH